MSFWEWFKSAPGYVPGCDGLVKDAWNEALRRAAEAVGKDELAVKRIEKLKAG